MFLLDSLMISGLRWTLQTILTAADAERDDDHALREQLLEAEVRREAGEISDEAFARTERDLLARIREIRERREGGSGPIAFGLTEAGGGASGQTLTVEASVGGEFHTSDAEPGPDAGAASAATPRPTGSSRAKAKGGRRAARRTRTARVR